MNLVRIARTLVEDVRPLVFGPPVTHVYNPLEYARRSYETYARRYGQGPREIVLLGMNPGPWGMAQTGVPFGEVQLVREWLGIDAPVDKPPREHPKRQVQGFACRRHEVSGARVWTWARRTFGTPRRFFRRFFVANYCPLLFLEASGRNRTPDKLPADQRAALLEACDRALLRMVDYFRPRFVIGFGTFAERRARAALSGLDVTVGGILHPSPASPAANRNWSAKASAELAALGIRLPNARC